MLAGREVLTRFGTMFRPPLLSPMFRPVQSTAPRLRPFPIVLQYTPTQQQTRGHAIYEPRRQNRRTTHKGVIPVRTGGSTKGTTLQYGDYGLRIIKSGLALSARQLQTADNILRKAMKEVKGSRIYYRFNTGRAVCKKGNEVRMGKGKGGFDHWGVLYPAGRMLFEISAPDIRREIAKEALMKAGKALPGAVGFVDKTSGLDPATIGLSRTAVFHAGFKVEGPIDTKIRSREKPPVVASKQIGYEKLAKTPKGLVRRA